MSNASVNCSSAARPRPAVWYVAAGYKLPAGVEAYLLHYATELRRHGFDTRIIVFERLPRVRHRYLAALEARGIPIESLYAACAVRVWAAVAVGWLPWLLYTLVRRRTWPRAGDLYAWMNKRCAVARLRRMIRDGRPDIVHVKARLIAEAWPAFPPERTVYQHALSGTLDDSWTPAEVEAFRDFLNRVARVFAPGRGVAEVLARAVGVTRPIDVLFTMAPDELPAEPEAVQGSPFNVPGSDEDRAGADARPADPEPGTRNREPGTSALRFGILCRFAPQKGIAYILEALRLFRDRHGDVDFTFAGQGELEPDIRRFIGTHGLAHVRVTRVESPPATLRELDVFVHPGLDDAMPVSLVEALMCGVPCIATRVGGVPDLVRDGVEGFLIAPSSSAQILDAMERFAAMPAAERAAFRRRARVRYEECCTPQQVGAAVAEHYRRIIRGQRTDDRGQQRRINERAD
jgi:glycosyltransferase involved in cell wall biosynthesis